MDASLMMRMGLPNAFSKSNPTHPFPRCFGSLTIRPSRTGDGNPIAMASNFQSLTKGPISATISRGVNCGPDLNFRFFAREIISFTCEPPTSMTRIFLVIMTVSCFHPIVQETWKHLLNDLVAQRCVFDRERQFDPPVEISRHPICAREEHLRLSGVFEMKNPAVLEKAANDTDDANVFAETRNFGTQTTDTADDEINGHVCAGSFVKSLDDRLIDERIWLRNDTRL